jgi:hypothetical protein
MLGQNTKLLLLRYLFVDCSLSTDHTLRQLAEQSMDNCWRRLPKLATTLMYLRLLDYQVRYDSDIPEKDLPPRTPDATAWLNLLGDISRGSHEESQQSNRFFRRKARELADALESDDPDNLAIDILRGNDGGHSVCWRLAEALTLLMGTDRTAQNLQTFFNACLMVDEPNGIARRRRIRLRNVTSGQKTGDMTSLVLSNTALEFLVHRHLRSRGKSHKAVSLSFPGFICLLRERYGFHIDQAPPDLPVPNDMLLRNRQILERRLRDLGLLVGVNDAENMKRLQQRFDALGDMETP